MAIEDEIINIADIDVGTEILKTDKLLIETNNGTKLLEFKDFVVGPDNIRSVRQDQIEGNASGETNTSFSVVTGFNILTDSTTSGLNTKYSDISGTIELGKFNYNAIERLASLSAETITNKALIAEVLLNITNLQAKLEATDSSVLNSIVLTTSACNFSVEGGTGGHRSSNSKSALSFTKASLDPATTNPNCSLQLAPFLITFPDAGEGFVDNTRYLIEGSFNQSVLAPSANSKTQGTITIYVDKADGTSSAVHTSVAESAGAANINMGYNNVTKILTINTGDKIRFSADSPVTGSLNGTKLNN